MTKPDTSSAPGRAKENGNLHDFPQVFMTVEHMYFQHDERRNCVTKQVTPTPRCTLALTRGFQNPRRIERAVAAR
jgi:hypothetical protein